MSRTIITVGHDERRSLPHTVTIKKGDVVRVFPYYSELEASTQAANLARLNPHSIVKREI